MTLVKARSANMAERCCAEDGVRCVCAACSAVCGAQRRARSRQRYHVMSCQVGRELESDGEKNR